VFSWVAATGLFVCIVQTLHGPSGADSFQSTTPAWMIAHGRLSCVYTPGQSPIAPLYPFLAAGFISLFHIGQGVAPLSSGVHCQQVFNQLDQWESRQNDVTDALRFGYVGWIALVAGVVTVLRACGRGRCVWEPATLFTLACLPPVWICLENFFHPQDLLAMGLALCAVACARKDAWSWAGIFVTLAVLSQQFALLVAAPLLILAPPGRRLRYFLSAIVTDALAVLVLALSTSGGGLDAVFLGTGNTGGSGSWLSATHLHGAPLEFFSRILPIVLSVVVSLWVVRRLGVAALEPIPLIATVAVSLSLRLALEQATWGYYFMALSVALVLLDAVCGHLRTAVVAWLIMTSVVCSVGPTSSSFAFARVSWGEVVQHAITPVLIVLVLVVIGLTLARRERGWGEVLIWIALLVGLLLTSPSTHEQLGEHFSGGFWQVILVASGILIAGTPLAKFIQVSSETRPQVRSS
jgi:hypothetical protein